MFYNEDTGTELVSSLWRSIMHQFLRENWSPTRHLFLAIQLTILYPNFFTSKYLLNKYHLTHFLLFFSFQFQPPISSRPANGFVGLCNAGATCYMNSILQQLYMQPGLKEVTYFHQCAHCGIFFLKICCDFCC